MYDTIECKDTLRRKVFRHVAETDSVNNVAIGLNNYICLYYVPTTSTPRSVAYLANRRRHHFDAPIRALAAESYTAGSQPAVHKAPMNTGHRRNSPMVHSLTNCTSKDRRGSNHWPLSQYPDTRANNWFTTETSIKQPSPGCLTTPPTRSPLPTRTCSSHDVFRSEVVP